MQIATWEGAGAAARPITSAFNSNPAFFCAAVAAMASGATMTVPHSPIQGADLEKPAHLLGTLPILLARVLLPEEEAAPMPRHSNPPFGALYMKARAVVVKCFHALLRNALSCQRRFTAALIVGPTCRMVYGWTSMMNQCPSKQCQN